MGQTTSGELQSEFNMEDIDDMEEGSMINKINTIKTAGMFQKKSKV